MQRKNFYLADRQIKNLDTEGMNMGLSASEVLRRIIDDHFTSVYPMSGVAELMFSGVIVSGVTKL
jgi:hypothetical protein